MSYDIQIKKETVHLWINVNEDKDIVSHTIFKHLVSTSSVVSTYGYMQEHTQTSFEIKI